MEARAPGALGLMHERFKSIVAKGKDR
jgi:hypothetical protein